AFSIGSFSNASRDFVDVDSLKQVEIIRGPGSTLFGSDALGGVVSFVTKSPEDYLLGEDVHISARTGFNGADESMVASATLAARMGGAAGALRVTAREGHERDVPVADPLDADSLNILARLVFGDADAGGFALSLERFDAHRDVDVNSLERVQDFTAAFGFPFLIDTQAVRANDTRRRTRVSLGQQWTDGLGFADFLRWRAYQQDSRTTQDTFEARETLINGFPSAVERDRSFFFDESLRGFEINAATRFSTGRVQHQLAYGLEYEDTDTEQLRDGVELDLATGVVSPQVGPDLFPLRDFPRSGVSRSGAYLQWQARAGAVTLVPGLRWDRFDLTPELDSIFAEDNPGLTPVDLSASRWSPRLGVMFDATDRLQVFGQYSEGFRAPPVNDVNVGFTNFQFGYTSLPNPDLEAESSRGLEAGLRWRGARTRASASAFLTRYDNFIESFSQVGFDPVSQLLLFQSVNLDDVEIYGAEFRGQYRGDNWPEGLALNASGAWARGENRLTGQPLNTVSPFNGVVGLEFSPAGRGFGGSVVARGAAGVSRVDQTGGDLLTPPGYIVFDALGRWQLSKHVRLRAAVYNLTDEQYTPWLDVAGTPASTATPERFVQPGRQFSLFVDWTL
ncbi:MAG: TonB-dependent receptor, partial [Pseudomonadota bacterium]